MQLINLYDIFVISITCYDPKLIAGKRKYW